MGRPVLILIALLLAGCATHHKRYAPETDLGALCDGSISLLDSPEGVETAWQLLVANQQPGPRDIAVFIDGTLDSRKSQTNVWLLYEQAFRRGCTRPVVPWYHTGVGTFAGSELLGAAMGEGLGHLVRHAYEFVARTYRPGDRIFIFGFSRGAYAARALNGLIDFAGLPLGDDPDLPETIKLLYKTYTHKNDGLPRFDRRLRETIADTVDQKNLPMHADKVCVEAIGVYDTVPAMGLGRDDFPDIHRTGLYARKGFHALSLDEQRHDFKPLRFDDRVHASGPKACLHCDLSCATGRELHEVWFAGGHSDVGGGYPKTRGLGLSDVSRSWMLNQLAGYDLFPEAPGCEGSERDPEAPCELGELHDEYLADKLFHPMGLHWRRPIRGDVLHGSVLCRMQADALPHPSVREPGAVYRPQNLYFYGDDPRRMRAHLERMYEVTDYECTAN